MSSAIRKYRIELQRMCKREARVAKPRFDGWSGGGGGDPRRIKAFGPTGAANEMPDWVADNLGLQLGLPLAHALVVLAVFSEFCARHRA